jgi:two-component system, OmpR family, KDP operon response regulator KdpE
MKKITITLENEDGQQIMNMSASLKTELVLLDLGLHTEHSSHLLTSLRQWTDAPVMVLTLQGDALNTPAKYENGYKSAALPKEHHVNGNIPATAFARPVMTNGQQILSNGPIRMDLLRHEVSVDGKKVSLTPREYHLLQCFLNNQGRLLAHREILSEVWGPEHVKDTQYLRVYIGQLRNKLDVKPGLGKLIVAEAGIGYRMDKSPAASYAA